MPARMQRLGYTITPINPLASEILGERAYATLAEAPRPVGYGVGCLAAAGLFAAAAFYVRWQGWG